MAPLWRLALPVILAELGWMFMGIADLMMVGRLGPEAIGAVAVGNVAFHSLGLLAIGLLLGMDTLISQAVGAERHEDANHSLRQGLWLATVLGPALLLGMWGLVPLFPWLGLETKVLELAQPFTLILALSVIPIAYYTAQRRYLQSYSIVRPVTIALLSANVVNLFFNWVLIFGNLGFPALGVNGSAWSTVIARLYLALYLYVALRRLGRPGLFAWSPPDWGRIRELFWLGLPAAGHIFLEVAVFGTATALAARFPAVALAAHEVTLHHASLMYMVPLGISSAAAVRVGNEVGAGNFPRAKAAGYAAIWMAAAFMALSGVVIYWLPTAILGVYTNNREVIAFAVPLMFWAAAFQLFDGIQCAATGALRGVADTHTPFLANMAGYWLLGLPVGVYLCFAGKQGIPGLWIGLSIGLAVVAVILLVRWVKVKHAPGASILPYAADGSNVAVADLRDVTLEELPSYLKSLGKPFAIGGYGEDRKLYRRSAAFGDEHGRYRSVHLGIDIWAAAGTPVYAALDGVVHSFQDNAAQGDYGPTIILQHETVHTLYGHLDRASLRGLAVGQTVRQGQRIGALGDANENGGWPPHVHFQVIREMGSWRGDYPGVAFAHEREQALANCPDPNEILQLPFDSGTLEACGRQD